MPTACKTSEMASAAMMKAIRTSNSVKPAVDLDGAGSIFIRCGIDCSRNLEAQHPCDQTDDGCWPQQSYRRRHGDRLAVLSSYAVSRRGLPRARPFDLVAWVLLLP